MQYLTLSCSNHSKVCFMAFCSYVFMWRVVYGFWKEERLATRTNADWLVFFGSLVWAAFFALLFPPDYFPSVESKFQSQRVNFSLSKTYGQWMEPQGLWTILFGQSLLDFRKLFYIVLVRSCYWVAVEGDTQFSVLIVTWCADPC